jgi:hypothetical protein
MMWWLTVFIIVVVALVLAVLLEYGLNKLEKSLKDRDDT